MIDVIIVVESALDLSIFRPENMQHSSAAKFEN
jgi:hypothetical protein